MAKRRTTTQASQECFYMPERGKPGTNGYKQAFVAINARFVEPIVDDDTGEAVDFQRLCAFGPLATKLKTEMWDKGIRRFAVEEFRDRNNDWYTPQGDLKPGQDVIIDYETDLKKLKAKDAKEPPEMSAADTMGTQESEGEDDIPF